MRVLFDIVHPAHVHFYKHLIRRLTQEGHEYRVVAREKDVTLDLLVEYGIPHVSQGCSAASGRIGQARELLARDWALLRLGRRFRPHFVLTRSPAGVQVSRLIGARGILDTDDGRAAGIHYRASAPFAHVITTPECMREDFGVRHRRYPGYKALAFLHPGHFKPDRAVLDRLGVGPDVPFFILRLVAMEASHDAGKRGLSPELARELVARLAPRGRVFVSTEGAMPPEFEPYRVRLPANRMHDALAFAHLLVGDSGSMAGEAAVLGVPNVFFGSFDGPRNYLDDLGTRYGLARTYRPEEGETMLAEVDRLTRDPEVRADWRAARARMLENAVDVSEWYGDLLEELLADRHPIGGGRSHG